MVRYTTSRIVVQVIEGGWVLMKQPPIAAIVEHYGGKLRRDYGSWQKIKCPFHKDTHASAGVCVTENLFVCHGCGIKGNPFNVIKVHEGVTYREAIKIAENITGEGYQLLRSTSATSRRLSRSTRDNVGSSTTNKIRRGR